MSVWGGDDPDFLEAAFRSVVHDQTRPPDDVVLVQDGPVSRRARGDDRRADRRRRPRRPRCWPSTPTSASASRSTRGWRPAPTTSWRGWTPTTSRCRIGSRSRCRSIEAGVDLVGSSLLEFGDRPGRHRRQAGPADRPRRDRPLRALPPAVQPPDGRLPAVGRRGRRRLPAPGADGGLPAVREDDRAGLPGGQRRGAAGALPGRCGRLRAARRCGVAQVRVAAAAPAAGDGVHESVGSSSGMSWFAAVIGWCPRAIRKVGVPALIAPKGER